MGIKTVFTDHSLYDMGSLHMVNLNAVIAWLTKDMDHFLAVSYVTKENMIFRFSKRAEEISVVPNALDCDLFYPDPSKRSKDFITVVYLSRIVYRKGGRMLPEIIRETCKKYQKVKFIIAGDGDCLPLIQKEVEENGLAERVQLLGAVKNTLVPSILVQGHIYLSTSLTESFGISVLEAASCGLFIVTTDVGGIPEILPKEMMSMSKPETQALIETLGQAIEYVESINGELPCFEFHQRIRRMYSWDYITTRIEKVYEEVSEKPAQKLIERVARFKGDPTARHHLQQTIMLFALMCTFLFVAFLEFVFPKEKIEKAIDLEYSKFQKKF